MKSQTKQGLFSMDVKRYPIIVSLDVHEGNIYMYAVDIRTGTIHADCNLPGKTGAVLKHLQKIHINIRQTVIIYEAGPATCVIIAKVHDDVIYKRITLEYKNIG